MRELKRAFMLNEFRRLLYALARGVGDLNALFKGKIFSRIFNKLMGRGVVPKLWSRGCGCLLALMVAVTVAVIVYVVL